MVLKRRGDFEKSEELYLVAETKGTKEVVMEVKTDPHDPAKKLIKTKKFSFGDKKLISISELKELLK